MEWNLQNILAYLTVVLAIAWLVRKFLWPSAKKYGDCGDGDCGCH
ncbi:FeoB-associated Cys-rich membrane protein [Robiginitalea sp. SP8]|nr:FeoB-associated Cys-rich membrane protein [Robiginitalea sp. SP8]MDC6373434.1 FeoB-associated Cys-rich membrane protein [Robiginitalea sp. SP8]